VLTLGVAGKGSIAVAGAGTCNNSCTTAWIDGAFLSLTAKPGSGWIVGAWSGACAGSAAQCTVSMTEARNVGVTFVRP
jgi:hypothetical protein